MKNGKWKPWAIVGTVVLMLAAVAFIQVYEKPPAKDAWLEQPAIFHEGRLFYWTRVFTQLPNEDGTWEMIGETAGVSYKTALQEGYLHAAEPHDHESGCDGCDTVEISEDVVGEIWASPECPDVRYVYLREGYHSQPWVLFMPEDMRNLCLICWNDTLYAASNHHISSGDVEKTEQLPMGYEETGRILKTSVDRAPTEHGEAVGVWTGMIDHAVCQTRYLGRKVWEHPEEKETIYLETYWNNKTYYIPAQLLTKETAGELTIPEQFLPLPE